MTVHTTRYAPGFRPTGSPTPADEPSLVVQVVWKGVGSADLEAHPHAWPFLRATIAGGGGTLEGTTGSLPLDPTATLTTIGTGGLPDATRHHGHDHPGRRRRRGTGLGGRALPDR